MPTPPKTRSGKPFLRSKRIFSPEDEKPLLSIMGRKRTRPAELECDVCKTMYKSPVLLDCMHTFCEQCVRSILEHTDDQTKLPCPVCRKETKVDEDGELRLLKNHVLHHKVLEEEVLDTLHGKGFACEDCELQTSTSLCHDCKWKLCTKCADHHKGCARSKNHTVEKLHDVDVEDLISSVKNMCRYHQDEEINRFCSTCHVPVCNECAWLKPHQGHQFQALHCALEGQWKSFKRFLCNSNSRCEAYSSHLEELEQFHTSSVEQRELSIKLIRDQAAARLSEFARTLSAEEEELVNWVNETKGGADSTAFKDAKQRGALVKSINTHLNALSKEAHHHEEDISDIVYRGIPKWNSLLLEMDDVFPESVKTEYQLQVETHEVELKGGDQRGDVRRPLSDDFIKLRKLFPASPEQACVRCHTCRNVGDEEKEAKGRPGRFSSCGKCGHYT